MNKEKCGHGKIILSARDGLALLIEEGTILCDMLDPDSGYDDEERAQILDNMRQALKSGKYCYERVLEAYNEYSRLVY
jgi:hypothetical protein